VAGPVLLLVPAASPGLALEDDGSVTLLRYRSGDEAAAFLERHAGPAVLCSDGLESPDHERVAAAIRASTRDVIEVRAARWNGTDESPVSAACRGAIAGFGPAAIACALRLLDASPAP
jgi:hypothetical protein